MFRDTIVKNKAYLSIMVGGILIFYVPLIYSFPIFYSDDLYIFYSISKHPLIPIALEINEKFFLFFRPVTYIYLWLQFQIFSDSAIMMKYFACLINIITIVSLFFTIDRGNNKYHHSINMGIVAVLCLALGLHRDYAQSVLWISNINELLAALFYVLAFYVLIGDITKIKNTLIIFFFFVLSVLSKQQGLHFPILLILYRMYLSKSFSTLEKRNLHYLIAGTLFVAALLSAVNYFIYLEGNNYFLESLWKKPFSIFGTIFYMLFPAVGEKTYNYFLIHKNFAFITTAFIMLATIYICSIYKEYIYQIRKTILSTILIAFIVFIPRIAAEGGDRLNGILLIWLTVGLSFLFSKIRRKIIYAVLFIVVIQNIYSSVIVRNEFLNQENQSRYFMDKLLDDRKEYHKPLYVVPSISKMLSATYKLEQGKFGVYEQVYFSDVIAKNPISKEFLKTVSVRREDNKITIEVDSNSTTYLLLNQNYNLQITNCKKSDLRGYSTITFELPDTLLNYRIVQFDGNNLFKK
jgi:hypothetical protein